MIAGGGTASAVCASTTAMDSPSPLSASANAAPAMPAPIITTSKCCGSAMVTPMISTRTTRHAGGITHKLPLQCWQDIESGKAQVAAEAEQRVGMHEQRGNTVAEENRSFLVWLLPVLVALQ